MGEHAGSSRAASGGEPGRSIERVSADQHPVGEPGFDQVRDHVDQTPVSWMAGAVGPVESEKRAGAGELQSRPERGLRIVAARRLTLDSNVTGTLVVAMGMGEDADRAVAML